MKPATKKYALVGIVAIGAILLVLPFIPNASAVETNCSDGIDNDNDGYVDDADSDCDTIPIDTDGDGITDDIDQCDTQPETYNGYQDTDGCPDTLDQDSDGDGIPDSTDACPSQPETVNGYLDNDGCPDTPPCPQWYHIEGTACVPDAYNYGLVIQDLGLDTNWIGAYYDGGRWRILIENPWYLQESPPAPQNVYYLTRWVGPNGVIYEEDVSAFGAVLQSDGTREHHDDNDEIEVGGIHIPLGDWQVHVFVTNQDITSKRDVPMQYLGSDSFTATDAQNSIIKPFCLFYNIC